MGKKPACLLPALLPVLLALTGCEHCKWLRKKENPAALQPKGDPAGQLKGPAAKPPMEWDRPSAAAPHVDPHSPNAPLSPANSFQPSGNVPAGASLVPNVSMKNKVNPEAVQPMNPPNVPAQPAHPLPPMEPGPAPPPVLIAPRNPAEIAPPPENMPNLVIPPSAPEGPSGVREPIRVQPPIDLPPPGDNAYGPPPLP